eukprot:TRINITY_DN10596_c0_g5_i2.p1 TRINITY_DN10596_c0_g5~~TRINITY_DN10596_c0_g5_i2.p1  ORF type:complete len:225 (+),score=51.11 TRINITY_DN10596_c0_g5_i2:92-766(+)
MAMMTANRRRHTVLALLLVACITMPLVLNFMVPTATMRSKATRPEKVRLAATSFMRMPLIEMNQLPWAEDLEGAEALQHEECLQAVESCLQHMADFDKSLSEGGMSEAQLQEYDRILAAGIRELEDKISETHRIILRDSMEVKNEAQLLWLDSMLQSIGDLRRQLHRIRDVEGKLQASMAKTDRGFLQTLIQAAAVALGGHRAVLHNDYPASGVASYTGEPEMR